MTCFIEVAATIVREFIEGDAEPARFVLGAVFSAFAVTALTFSAPMLLARQRALARFCDHIRAQRATRSISISTRNRE